VMSRTSPLHRTRRTPLRRRCAARNRSAYHHLALTISLIAVLIPLLFMAESSGGFSAIRHHLAVTISGLAVVSSTLTPMMCASSSNTPRRPSRGACTRASERGPGHHCGVRLHLAVCPALANPPCWVALGTLVLTAYSSVPSQSPFPDAGYGRIQGVSEAGQTVSLADVDRSSSRSSR